MCYTFFGVQVQEHGCSDTALGTFQFAESQIPAHENLVGLHSRIIFLQALQIPNRRLPFTLDFRQRQLRAAVSHPQTRSRFESSWINPQTRSRFESSLINPKSPRQSKRGNQGQASRTRKSQRSVRRSAGRTATGRSGKDPGCAGNTTEQLLNKLCVSSVSEYLTNHERSRHFHIMVHRPTPCSKIA